MDTRQRIIARASETYQWLLGAHPDLNPEVMLMYALIDGFLYVTEGTGAPEIISGYRTLADNRRVGGAQFSWHLVGRALDLAGRKNAWAPQMAKFGALWGLLGGRWGGNFDQRDYNHFDLPGSPTPEEALRDIV